MLAASPAQASVRLNPPSLGAQCAEAAWPAPPADARRLKLASGFPAERSVPAEAVADSVPMARGTAAVRRSIYKRRDVRMCRRRWVSLAAVGSLLAKDVSW